MTTTQANPNDGLNIEQASKFLGVHRNTLRRKLARGEIAHARLGPRTVRISRRLLEQMLSTPAAPTEAQTISAGQRA